MTHAPFGTGASPRFAIDTAATPGPIAVVRLRAAADHVARALRTPVPAVGAAALVRLPDLDDAVLARPGAEAWLLMPHGGPAIVRAVAQSLRAAGMSHDPDSPGAYPEANDAVEAAMLAALARAASPRAIPLLLRQPERWRRLGPPTDADRARSARLDRLVDPPLVVAVGAPNCGKSTLAGALAGRPVAIVSPIAGTTRDPVIAEVELDGLVVRWADAAGLGPTADPLEALGIAAGRSLLGTADLVVALAEPGGRWPGDLPPNAICVGTKADLGADPPPGAAVEISVHAGIGLEDLSRTVRGSLVPDVDLDADHPWRFPGAPADDCPA